MRPRSSGRVRRGQRRRSGFPLISCTAWLSLARREGQWPGRPVAGRGGAWLGKAQAMSVVLVVEIATAATAAMYGSMRFPAREREKHSSLHQG